MARQVSLLQGTQEEIETRGGRPQILRGTPRQTAETRGGNVRGGNRLQELARTRTPQIQHVLRGERGRVHHQIEGRYR